MDAANKAQVSAPKPPPWSNTKTGGSEGPLIIGTPGLTFGGRDGGFSREEAEWVGDSCTPLE